MVDDTYSLVERMLVATRRTKLISGGVVTVLGVPLLLLPLFVEAQLWEAAVIAGLGAAAFGMGGFQLFQAMQLRDVKNAPLMRVIRNEPDKVVWIYEFVMRVNGVPNNSVFLWCNDGKKYEFNLRQADTSALIAGLSNLLPKAVVGYSPELKKLYKRAPAQFVLAAQG